MKKQMGLSLVEIMVGLTLGLIITIAILIVYLAQVKIYKSTTSQAKIQDAEYAISGLIIPVIRSAGYVGCTNLSQVISNLNPGGPPPLGNLGGAAVMGYDAAAGNTITISQSNAPNDSNINNWSPVLDPSLQGSVEVISDVVVVLGGSPGASPIGVKAITPGSNSMTLQNTNGVTAGQFAAISDCAKATVFLVTGASGTNVTHAAGTGALTNTSDVFSVNYPVGSQFILLSQTAFFVARDPSGQSSLVRATLNSNGTWTIQAMIPGVDSMQVLYGIGANGTLSAYVPASSVTNWSQVYAVRLGFLLSGDQGSATLSPTQYNFTGTAVNVPDSTHLRHVFEVTINIRNSNS